MQVASQNAQPHSESAVPKHSNAWQVLGWCFPALLGFAAFLVSFPIDRRVSFWPHLSLAEVFGAWFLFVTPVANTAAIVTLIKRTRLSALPLVAKWLLVAAVTLAVLLNLFVLLGLYAAAAF